MAEFRLSLDDLENDCLECYGHPGKKLADGKWLGDKCLACKGIGKVPTTTGAAVLEFIGRHAPAKSGD